jgi:DNA-binding PadR family transcriptional regulator
MRVLKYAILGLLNRQPMTGYDLSKEFDQDLMNFWHARHSQIYPELRKLTEENLIQFEVQISGEILKKKVYSITDLGQADLKQWLLKEEELEPTPKDIFKLRMYFSENMKKEQLYHLVKDQYDKRFIKYNFLKQHLDEYVDKPVLGSPEFGDYMVLLSAAMREHSYLDWLNICLDKCI